MITMQKYEYRVREMCADMINLAMRDCVRFSGNYESSAKHWLNDDKNKNAFSFKWCCDRMGLSHLKIRRGIFDKCRGMK